MSDAAQAKPKLLVVSLRYPPYVAGGYELLTRDAVQALRERGYEVAVLCAEGEQFAGLAEIYPFLKPNLDGEQDLFEQSFKASNRERFGYHFYSRANAAATERALQESGAELLFYFNLGLVSLAPIVAARRRGLPCLGYISDPWPLNHWIQAWQADPRQRKKALRLRLLRWIWRVYSMRVQLGPLLTCSNFMRERMQRAKVASTDIRTLHLGVPPDMEVLAAPKSTPQRGPAEVLRIACISSFWEGKGQSLLLDALGVLQAKGVQLELVLAGTGGGEYLERLKQQAEGLAGSVRCAQGLDRTAVSELLAASHVLVVPSTWGEPFPLASLEGMVHGCALLVSDDGGSAEAIEDGVHGLVVPAGDAGALASALERLALDEGLRARLGSAARQRAQSDLSHRAFVDGLEAALLAQSRCHK